MDLKAFSHYLVKNNILRQEEVEECFEFSQMQEARFLLALEQKFYFSEERLQRYIKDFQELQEMLKLQKKSAELPLEEGENSQDSQNSQNTLLKEVETASSQATLIPFQEAPKTLLDPLMLSAAKEEKTIVNAEINIFPSSPSKETLPKIPLPAAVPKKESILSVSEQDLLKEMESLGSNQVLETPPPPSQVLETKEPPLPTLQASVVPLPTLQASVVPLPTLQASVVPQKGKKTAVIPAPKTAALQKNVETVSTDFSKKRYDLIEVLGEGGMGVVQRVKDSFLGREVALKRIKMAPEGFQKLSEIQQVMLWRLSREAEITANLEHPNIVPVYDMQQQSNGEVYFTMRKVVGETLRSILSRSLQNPEEQDPLKVLSIFLKVCDAISYSHSRKIIHRDLKPENIMVGAYGNVYVMDWGIAKSLEETPEDTLISSTFLPTENTFQTIGGIGTRGYMPPEQEKNANQVLPQSDIYALGKILRQCFTLLSPEEEFKLQISQDQQQLKSVKSKNDFVREELALIHQIPLDIQAICKKATEEEWQKRYESVSALAEDVRQYLQQGRVSVRSYSFLELLKKWGKKQRRGILFILLLGILTPLLYYFLSLKNKRLQRESEEKIAQHEKEYFFKALENKKNQKEKLEALQLSLNQLEEFLPQEELFHSKSSEQYFEDGLKNLEQNRFESAEKDFSKILETFNPSLSEDSEQRFYFKTAWSRGKARQLLAQNQPLPPRLLLLENAIQDYENAKKMCIQAQFNEPTFDSELNDLRRKFEAEKCFSKATEYQRKGIYPEAIKSYSGAIQYQLNYWEAYLLRAVCKKEENNPLSALEDIEIFLKNFPKYPENPHLTRAKTLERELLKQIE